jgi:hypothetical protein
MYKINQFVNGPGPPCTTSHYIFPKIQYCTMSKEEPPILSKKLRTREENTNLTDMLLCRFWRQTLATKGGHHACLVIATAGASHAGHGPLLQRRWGKPHALAHRHCSSPSTMEGGQGGMAVLPQGRHRSKGRGSSSMVCGRLPVFHQEGGRNGRRERSGTTCCREDG